MGGKQIKGEMKREREREREKAMSANDSRGWYVIYIEQQIRRIRGFQYTMQLETKLFFYDWIRLLLFFCICMRLI